MNKNELNIRVIESYSYVATKSKKYTQVIKVDGKTIYRTLDKEVIIDIRDEYDDIYKKINKKSNENKSDNIVLEEIKKDSKIMAYATKLYKNKKIKKLVITLGCLIMAYAFYSSLTIPVAACAIKGAPDAIEVWKEMDEVKTFISFIINVIRALAVSLCALLVAETGLKVLVNENSEGQKETKRIANKVLWALFLIFIGTSIASIISYKLIGGL